MPTARKYYLIFFSSKISVGSASFYDWHVLSCLFQSLKVFFRVKTPAMTAHGQKKMDVVKTATAKTNFLLGRYIASVSQDASDTALQK
jgi:hypothetical protein